MVLAFEPWILILKLSIMGQQCSHAPRINGVDLSELRYSSRMSCFDLRVVDFNSPNHLLAGNDILLLELWPAIL
jgi:hypothetical protein